MHGGISFRRKGRSGARNDNARILFARRCQSPRPSRRRFVSRTAGMHTSIPTQIQAKSMKCLLVLSQQATSSVPKITGT